MDDVIYTSDARPVTRCAWCRHCYDAGDAPQLLTPYDGVDVWYCDVLGFTVSSYARDPYKWYCAAGERRTP